jgi:hypothetical protein
MKGAARLANGRWVSLDSEEWRADCEARLYASLEPHIRAHYVNRVTHFRGDAAAQRLLYDAAHIRESQ